MEKIVNAQEGLTTKAAGNRDGFAFRMAHQHPDMGDDPLEDLFKAADMSLVRQIGDILYSEYMQPWKVEVSHRQGIVKIGIPELMGEDQWYVIKIRELETDPSFRLVRRAAGEVLERYRIPRMGKFSEFEFMEALKRHPLGYRGAPVPE